MDDKSPEELQNQLQEKAEQLRNLKYSRRKAKIVNWLGLICGFGLVAIFVYLFISPVFELRDKAQTGELNEIIQRQIEDKRLAEDLQRSARIAEQELRPIYQEKILEKVKELQTQEKAREEARLLAQEVWEIYEPRLQSRVDQLKPWDLAQENLQMVLEEVRPTYAELVRKKIEEYGVAEAARKEGSQLVENVTPVYWEEISRKIDEMGIVEEIRAGAGEVVDRVRPTYAAELDRVKPEMTDAFHDETDILVKDLQVVMREKMKDAIRASLERQEKRLKADLELTDQEMDDLMTNLALANQRAMRRLFEKRTQRHRVLLEEARLELEKIPLASEYDLAAIEDKLFRVTITLLKYKLPDYYEGKDIQID